jgi:hypothetical protein
MDKELIDGCFYVVEKRYGTFDSYDQEGKCIVTSPTEEHCINATRFILQLKQKNRLNQVEVSYSSTVDGKL